MKSCYNYVHRTSNLTGAGADCPYSLVATHSYIAPLSSLVNLSKYKTLGASLNLDPPTGLLPDIPRRKEMGVKRFVP